MKPMLSIIVPLAPNENEWQQLLPALLALKIEKEILLVCTEQQQASAIELLIQKHSNVFMLVGEGGRASLMNTAAASAKAEYLWFVHADTGLPENCAELIAEKIRKSSDALYYFNLGFWSDGPRHMKINAIGVYIRSHYLKLPFGDQAFLIKKQLFEKIGTYNESVNYGEDHLLVWQAHHNKVPVKCISAKVFTSARKYQAYGWGVTTRKHLLLTFKQAYPQFIYLMKGALNK
jgi:glycosyltransferase involved in cell wall biosynthesis